MTKHGDFHSIKQPPYQPDPAFGAMARVLETFRMVLRGSHRFNGIFSPLSV